MILISLKNPEVCASSEVDITPAKIRPGDTFRLRIRVTNRRQTDMLYAATINLQFQPIDATVPNMVQFNPGSYKLIIQSYN